VKRAQLIAAMAAAVGAPFNNPFAIPLFGAKGGARGSCPFPAPRRDRFVTRVVYSNDRPLVLKTIAPPVVNTTPQPWERHAAKLAKRERLGWNDRRIAREKRRALENVSLAS